MATTKKTQSKTTNSTAKKSTSTRSCGSTKNTKSNVQNKKSGTTK